MRWYSNPPTHVSSALVRTARGEEWVDVTMLGDVAPNDLILVHAGAADRRDLRDE